MRTHTQLGLNQFIIVYCYFTNHVHMIIQPGPLRVAVGLASLFVIYGKRGKGKRGESWEPRVVVGLLKAWKAA